MPTWDFISLARIFLETASRTKYEDSTPFLAKKRNRQQIIRSLTELIQKFAHTPINQLWNLPGTDFLLSYPRHVHCQCCQKALVLFFPSAVTTGPGASAISSWLPPAPLLYLLMADREVSGLWDLRVSVWIFCSLISLSVWVEEISGFVFSVHLEHFLCPLMSPPFLPNRDQLGLWLLTLTPQPGCAEVSALLPMAGCAWLISVISELQEKGNLPWVSSNVKILLESLASWKCSTKVWFIQPVLDQKIRPLPSNPTYPVFLNVKMKVG